MPSEGLDVAPGRTQRRRRIRTVARLAAFLFIIVGSYYYVREIDFKAMLPTDWVLALDRLGVDWAPQHLWRTRFCEGKLSQAEAAAFLSQQVLLSPLEVTSPHPDGESVCLRMSVESTGWFRFTQFAPTVKNWSVEVDGEPTSFTVESFDDPADLWTQRFRIRVGALGIGSHEVAVSGTCVATDKPGRSGTGIRICGSDLPPPELAFARSVRLLIEPGTVEEFAKPVKTPQLMAHVRDLVEIRAVGKPGTYLSAVFVSCESLPIPLAGHIHMKATSAGEYQHIRVPLVFPTDKPTVLPVFDPEIVSIKPIHSLDVLFTPDAKLALDAGFTEYLDCALEWTAVPLRPPNGRAVEPVPRQSRKGAENDPT